MTFGVLMLGNFTSNTTGIRGMGEDLHTQLVQCGWQVIVASRKRGRVDRLTEMVFTAWRKRNLYSVALIEVYSGLAFIWAELTSAFLRLLRKPVILVLHGGNLPVFAARWPGRVNNLLSSATCVTTPSWYIRNSFRDIRPYIQVIPNGLDIGRYEPRTRSVAHSHVAWLRAFHAVYCPTMAIEALAHLTADFPDVRLTMFGPDKRDGTFQEAMKLAKRLGVATRIETPGAIPKHTVPQRLSEFDIFLNTTTAESFGVSVVEAAALGMCIVTTNVGELSYIWTHDHDALLVPPKDPQAMAAAVRRILKEPELAERLSRNARTTAERFDWANIRPQWEKLLAVTTAVGPGERDE